MNFCTELSRLAVSAVAFLLVLPALAKVDRSIRIEKQAFVVSGDQLIETDLFEAATNQMSSIPFAARPTKVELWQDGVIPITFNKEVEPPLQKMVFDACLEWAKTTPKLRCQLGAYKGKKLKVSRSFMGNSSGCWSMLGQGAYFMGLRRHMNLGYGCDRFSVVLHEMGHVLGLAHEHQRSDRDKYVVIHQENVSDPYAGFNTKLNFARQKTELVTAYDFLSIMHYHRNAFSKNGQDTIVPRDGYAAFIDQMGNVNGLSELDRQAMAKLYKTKKLEE